VLLLVTLFVALVGVAMMDATVREVQIAVNESNSVQARYLAEAGIADAASHMSQDNTWTGPITQTLGGGSYTVQVDTAVSNTAVRSVVSAGTVLPSTAAAASQTVRETFLVLPAAFSKAVFSNTVATVAAIPYFGPYGAINCSATSGSRTGAITNAVSPTAVSNTVLRQLGTIHVNNACAEHPAVSVLGTGTTVTGGITIVTGTTNIGLGAQCIACAPVTGTATIPFPTFNWSNYQTLATNNPNYAGPTHSPCPATNATGTFFTSEATFDSCVAGLTADPQGFRTLNGVIYLQAAQVFLAHNLQEENLRIFGTLVVYTTTGAGPGTACSVTTPCGELDFWALSGPVKITITAQNGEPAILAGGSILQFGGTQAGTVTINGLVYLLASTANPTSTTRPLEPGYELPAAHPPTINGMLVGQRLNGINSNAVKYDPSSFYQGLPSGLNSPGQPYVLLPISWSSGK